MKAVVTWWRSSSHTTTSHAEAYELGAKLGANNAQTPGNTSQHPVPEDEASQQHPSPRRICKTSIPGSNPGGASNLFRVKFDHCAPMAQTDAAQMDANGLQIALGV
jgi:hypothetical protein